MKHDILVRMSQFNTSGEELKGLRKLFTDIKLRKTDERPVICEKSILLYYLNHDTATNTRDDALGGLADRRQFGLSEYGTFCATPLVTALTLLPYNVIIQSTSEPEEGQRPRSTRIACTGQSEWTMGRFCSLEATLKVTGSHYASVPEHSPKKFPACHPPNDVAQADCRRNKGSLQCNST